MGKVWKLIKAFKAQNGRLPNGVELEEIRRRADRIELEEKVIEFPRSKITDWRKPRPTDQESRVIPGGSKEGREITEKLGIITRPSRPQSMNQEKVAKDLEGLMKQGLIKKGKNVKKTKAKEPVDQKLVDDVRNREMFEAANKRLTSDQKLIKEKYEASNKIAAKNLRRKKKKKKEGIESIKTVPDLFAGKVSLPLRLMKNWNQELDYAELAAEGYTRQQIEVLMKAKEILKRGDELNPNEALLRVKEEMADARGIDVEDFTEIDFEVETGPLDFASGGRVAFQGGGADASTTSFSKSYDKQHGTNTARRANRAVDRRQAEGQRQADETNRRIAANREAAKYELTPPKSTLRQKIGGGINRVLNNPFVRTYAAWGTGGLSEKMRQAMMVKSLYDNRNVLGEEAIEDEVRNIPVTGGITSNYASGGRVRYGAGGINKMRRAFLKMMGAGAAGVGAAKSGLFNIFKGGGKQVAKELTQVPIKQTADMPAWFKPLVNKIIKEGEDVTKQNAFKERMVVHKTKLPESKTDIYVNQDLDSGDVWVDIGMGKHGWVDGHYGQPVRLEYKVGEIYEPIKTTNVTTGKEQTIIKGGKTPEEFWVEEAEFTGGHPENIKFEESTFEKFGNHGSNFDEVEMFATGKIKKSKPTKKAQQLEWEQGKAEADAEAAADMADDFADGGRVSRWMGGGLSKGKRTLSELLKMMSKDSSHGKSPSEMLQMINPKQFNPMLDRPEGIPSIAKEMIEKYTKEMKGDRVNMIQDLIATGRRIKKVDDDLVNYKIKIVEDMVSKGTDRATAKEMAETLADMVAQGARKKATPKITDQGLLELENIGKNLATTDRKLNASGGIARMLGE